MVGMVAKYNSACVNTSRRSSDGSKHPSHQRKSGGCLFLTKGEKMKKSILLLSLLLGACASMPTKQEMARADYGRAISQTECENIAKSEIQRNLKDAGSAIFEFGSCEKRGMHSIPVANIPKQYGYFLPVRVNAKNSFGGYTGFRNYNILLKNGNVIRKTRQDDEYGLMFPF